MTKYKNLAELVGKENILNKKNLLKLKGSKIILHHYDDSLKDAIVYTDNNYDFALVYKAENDSSFVYVSLTSEIIGKRLNPKRHFVLARPPGFMFIHKGTKPTDKYALNDACYDSIKLAFDKVHGDVLPKFDFKKLYSNVCLPSSDFSTENYVRATEIPYVDPYFEKLIAKNSFSHVLSKEKIASIEKKLYLTHSRLPLTKEDLRVENSTYRPILSDEDEASLREKVSLDMEQELLNQNPDILMADYFSGLEFKNPIKLFLDLFRSRKN